MRYRLRVCSEFAKIAMADQTLDHGEVVNVRWAYTDPNPIAKAHEEQAIASQFVNAVEKRVTTVYLITCSYLTFIDDTKRKIRDGGSKTTGTTCRKPGTVPRHRGAVYCSVLLHVFR